MASGVGLEPKPNVEEIVISTNSVKNQNNKLADSFNKNRVSGISRLSQILKDSGLNIPDKNLNQYVGTGLAKNFVLFNTLSSFNFDNENSQKFGEYTFRQGINLENDNPNWINLDSTYGLGGNSMGIQPTPGITEISIDCVNRGSIRKATVSLKAFNLLQFSLIELLYLRLGYNMMLEWGWDKYIEGIDSDTGQPEIQDMDSTLIDDFWFKTDNLLPEKVLEKIEDYRGTYKGNYDGFFGKVNNFNWKFANDGSYDITIELITVGSVVESLKTNTNAYKFYNTEEEKKKKEILSNQLKNQKVIPSSPLYNSLGNNVLITTLREYVLNYTSTPPEGYTNPLYSPTSLTSSINAGTYQNQDEISSYFITVGDFIGILRKTILLQISYKNNNTSPIIDIENSGENNLIYTNYNQFPFSPGVCIHNTIWSEDFINNKTNFKQNITSFIDNQLPKKFMKEKDGYIYGNLMNLYLNVDFLINIINDNLKEDKGNLYTLLQLLCSGLNKALGGLNNLEPIIKDDRVVTIIDQNPILGIKSIQDLPQTPKDELTQIEVYGYRDNKSNFLKSIDFVTKIDSSLSSMISIGATGDGTSTKNYEATSFSKWNTGLIDRYSPSIQEPIPSNLTALNRDLTTLLKNSRSYAEEKIKKIHIKQSIKNGSLSNIYSFIIHNEGGKFLPDLYSKNYNISSTKSEVHNNYEKSFINSYVEKVKTYEIFKDQKQYNQDQINNLSQNTYSGLLHYIMGHKFEPPILTAQKGEELKYPKGGKNIYTTLFTDKSLSERLSISYKNYITSRNNLLYSTLNDASGNIGFIPLHLNLNLEGISGVKIYNKLNVDTRFLPNNYQKSLDFLISKVNHKVSNNSWETSLSTLSTSNLDENVGDIKVSWSKDIISPNRVYLSSVIRFNGKELKNGVLSDTDLVDFKEFYKSAYKNYYGKSLSDDEYRKRVISPELNSDLDSNNLPIVRLNPRFAENLKNLYSLTFKYNSDPKNKSNQIHLKINSAYRTLTTQKNLKKHYDSIDQPTRAAIPGTSKHGYGIAVDFGDSNGKVIKVNSKEYKWLKENAKKFDIKRLPWAGQTNGEAWESWHWQSLILKSKEEIKFEIQKELNRLDPLKI